MVHSSGRPRACALLVGGLALVSGGCGLTSKSQLDECRQRGQALRTENGRLKDQVLTLRSQNQDIAQRSVDDERRLQAQDAALARLEDSVKAYQDDRERLAAAYDRLKVQIQSTAGPEASVPVPGGLGRFAEAHPGVTFDADARALTLPVERLFVAGTADLRPDAAPLLKGLSEALESDAPEDARFLVAAPPDDVAVVRTDHRQDGTDPLARQRFLAMARAGRVRERLAEALHRDDDRIRVADPDAPAEVEVSEPGPSPARAFVIRLGRSAPPAPSSGP